MALFKRFFLKLIILLFILNGYLILGEYGYIDTSIVNEKMYTNINFSKVISVFKGDLLSAYFKDEYIEVDSGIYIMSSSDGDRLILNSNNVLCIDTGQVIKIERNKNLYKVYIQANDNIYVYYGLDSVSAQMYEIIKTNEVIGISNYYDNGNYYCFIRVLNSNSMYEK